MPKTVSMIWAMYKWQIMLIYCMSYIGFGKNLLVDVTKAFIGPSPHKFEHCVKNDEYGLSLTVFSCA